MIGSPLSKAASVCQTCRMGQAYIHPCKASLCVLHELNRTQCSVMAGRHMKAASDLPAWNGLTLETFLVACTCTQPCSDDHAAWRQLYMLDVAGSSRLTPWPQRESNARLVCSLATVMSGPDDWSCKPNIPVTDPVVRSTVCPVLAAADIHHACSQPYWRTACL